MKKNSLVIFFLICEFLFLVQCHQPRNHTESSPEHSTDEVADTSAINFSAELFYEAGQYLEAANEYKKLITLDSLNGKYYFRRGYSLVQIDSFSLASKYYAKAAVLKYEEAECYFVIGTLYSRDFNDTLAIKCLEKALKLDPGMEKAKIFLSSLKKAQQNSIL